MKTIASLALLLSLLAPVTVFANWSGWIDAIKTNKVERLARMLPKQTVVDRTAPDGKTALMAAAAAGDLQLVNNLLDAGADPHRTNNKGASTLIYAAWGGNAAVSKRLIKLNVNLNQRASNGWTALTMAAAKGHTPIVRQLLESGSPVNLPDVYGWTALMRAVDRQRPEVVRLLLKRGKVDLHRINDRGQTALHVAANVGNPVIYQMLRSAGCDPQRVDFNGQSAQQIALAKGLKEPWVR